MTQEPTGREAQPGRSQSKRDLLFAAARAIALALDNDFTGQVVISVHHGKVGNVQVEEHLRPA